jgi:glucosamine 6-phosphate synthetase-like amidotransferase/phosphosugar isomerase protein
MCGIVSFWGQGQGVSHVLDALHLLQYRAPDSAGIAVVGPDGCFTLRRSTGGPGNLVRQIASRPLYAATGVDDDAVRALLRRQSLAPEPDTLRDCASFTIDQLFDEPPLHVGIGDRGGHAAEAGHCAVAFAFRLLGAHVAAREAVDETVCQALNAALYERLPANAYSSWREAWLEEVLANVPGHAFALAARYVQETFPGLASYLADGEWERIGGLTAQALGQMVMGHGRWAMVGAVSE